MGKLKRVLPEKVVSEAVEIIQVTFKEIHHDPSCGNHYAEIPSLKSILKRPFWSLDPLACSVKKKIVKSLSQLQHDNFSNQRVQDMVWAWDINLL